MKGLVSYENVVPLLWGKWNTKIWYLTSWQISITNKITKLVFQALTLGQSDSGFYCDEVLIFFSFLKQLKFDPNFLDNLTNPVQINN